MPKHGALWHTLCVPLAEIKAWQSVPLIEFQIIPRLKNSDILWVQEKGTHTSMSECGKNFTLTQDMSWGFLLCPTPLTQGSVDQPQYAQTCHVLSDGSDSPAPYPVTGLLTSRSNRTKARDQFSNPSLRPGKTLCWLTSKHLIFSFILCLENPKAGSGPTNW